jgi:hypothetical protein
MNRYLFVNHVPVDHTAGVPKNVEALNAWFESMGADRVDPGRGILQGTSLGNVGDGTRIGGYLFVTADDLDGALAVAKGCPFLELGGGIEVGLVAEAPPTSP